MVTLFNSPSLIGLGRGQGEGQNVGLTTNIEIKKQNF